MERKTINKKKLKRRKIFIDNDLTKKDTADQRKLRNIAAEERKRGNKAQTKD